MRALKRLFRRPGPHAGRERLRRAGELFGAAVARGEVQCRLCGRAGVHIHTFLAGPDRAALYALCDGCGALPDAQAEAERAMLAGERPDGPARFEVRGEGDLRRLAAL
jgi:hypothetical protein